MANRLREAKDPVSRLAGPYGHPFHPILVTVPIGAWVASFVFDIASRLSGEPGVFAKGAFGLIALSAVALGVLTVSGWLGGQLAYRLLGTWLSRGGFRARDIGASRFPPGLIFGHFLLAATAWSSGSST